MKRILSLILALIFCLSFVVSCENEEAPSSTPTSSSEPSQEESSSSSSLSSQEPNEEEMSAGNRFEHYGVLSTVEEETAIEVITSYEELVAFVQGKELYLINKNDAEKRLEFDPAVLKDNFKDSFVLAVPQGFEKYEDIYYEGIEKLDSGEYLITAVVTTNFDQLLDPETYNFDFVIVPNELYREDMKQKGFILEADFEQILPTYNIPEDTPYNNKVTSATKEKLHTMAQNERLVISVWLKAPAHTAVQGNGYTDGEIGLIKKEFYEKFSAYKQEHGDIALTDLPADVFRELSGLVDEQILNDHEIEGCLESVGGLDYTIKLYGIYKDQREYRQAIKRANEERREEFCALLDMERCTSLQKNSLLSIVSFECDRDYVLILQENSLVSGIQWSNPDDEVEFEDMEENLDACE